MELSNLHTHTLYCDGTCSVDEMIRGAIAKGFSSLGFSGHAHTDYADYEMTVSGTAEYIREVRALGEKYAGQIEIFCGIEQDYLSVLSVDGYDYVIGSTHSITAGRHECIVDWSEETLREDTNRHFGGDIYAYIEAYFAREADIAVKTRADIVGHFDLVTKFNEAGRLFDESHPRYRAAAIDSMSRIVKACPLFEVNTGAMFRAGRTEPYPSRALLRELLARGGEVILTSDSHDVESLGYRFGEMAGLLKDIGFQHRKVLTRSGFVDIKL